MRNSTKGPDNHTKLEAKVVLQSLVTDIITQYGSNSREVHEAAIVLRIPALILKGKNEEQIRKIFTKAIEPLQTVLEGKKNLTVKDVKEIAAAVYIFDSLSMIKRDGVPAPTLGANLGNQAPGASIDPFKSTSLPSSGYDRRDLRDDDYRAQVNAREPWVHKPYSDGRNEDWRSSDDD